MRPPTIVDVLLAELDDSALDVLAERLAPRLVARLSRARQPDSWLDTKQAAAYLGMSVNALHKKTATREIPFEQDGPGCKCWFRRSDLDAWRRGESTAGAAGEERLLPNRFQYRRAS